jgi:hypothetical protein
MTKVSEILNTKFNSWQYKDVHRIEDQKKLLLQSGVSNSEAEHLLKYEEIFTFDVDNYFRHIDASKLPKTDAPTSQQCREAGIHMFTFGIVLGYRVSDHNTREKELILAMRFNSWADLDDNTRHNITQLGLYFHKVAKTHLQVNTNAAWSTSGKRESHYCTGLNNKHLTWPYRRQDVRGRLENWL